MPTFSDLVESRKQWIVESLQPWCRTARLADLELAEQEWIDIAGKAAPEQTLWLWAWSRFPALYVEGLGGLEETYAVQVTLRDGSTETGYPDSRRSIHGRLFLIPSREALSAGASECGPISIDDIESVTRL